MIVLVGIVSIFMRHVLATSCFHCVSPDKQYSAAIRRQLATQTDIYFYPIGAKTTSCSDEIDPDDPPIIEGQICSKYEMCVTLFPNLPNTTFVVRGCFENILRHSYREDPQLHSQGCYLVRALPTFQNNTPMDYIICTCHGDYCNSMPIPSTVAKPYSFDTSNVLRVSASRPEGPLQIVSSSAKLLNCSVITLYFLIHKLF